MCIRSPDRRGEADAPPTPAAGRRGASPPTCTAPTATSTTPSRRRAFLLQLAARRLRELPRLRPHHRRRLRPGDAGRIEDAARRRGEALADGVFKECQDDLLRFAKKRGVALDIAWRDLPPRTGAGCWRATRSGRAEASWPAPGTASHFFAWLETKAYKMHIRVLLSRYRAYTPCEVCAARLKPDGCAPRLGGTRRRVAAVEALPAGRDWTRARSKRCPA
jgi:hypothetical protein